MSLEAINQVIFSRRPWWTTSDQIVALAIANHVGEDGTCYPSLRRIGAVSGLQRRQIQKILRRLEADKTIVTTEQYKDHRQTSNSYEWILDYGSALNPLRPGRPLVAVPDLFTAAAREQWPSQSPFPEVARIEMIQKYRENYVWPTG